MSCYTFDSVDDKVVIHDYRSGLLEAMSSVDVWTLNNQSVGEPFRLWEALAERSCYACIVQHILLWKLLLLSCCCPSALWTVSQGVQVHSRPKIWCKHLQVEKKACLVSQLLSAGYEETSAVPKPESQAKLCSVKSAFFRLLGRRQSVKAFELTSRVPPVAPAHGIFVVLVCEWSSDGCFGIFITP